MPLKRQLAANGRCRAANGLPAAHDTMANGTRSGAVVQRDKEPRDAATEADTAQTAKAEVVQHKKDQEFEIFDFS